MANFTTVKVGGDTGAVSALNNRIAGYFSLQFNIADLVAAGFVAGDTATLLTIPARTRLEILAVYNDTALVLGGTPVFSLGDAGSATQWVNASSTVSSGSAQTVATAAENYTTADVLKLTLSNSSGTVTSGKFSIIGRLVDLSANPVATAATA